MTQEMSESGPGRGQVNRLEGGDAESDTFERCVPENFESSSKERASGYYLVSINEEVRHVAAFKV